jgi:hypothetical protein
MKNIKPPFSFLKNRISEGVLNAPFFRNTAAVFGRMPPCYICHSVAYQKKRFLVVGKARSNKYA